MAEKIGKYKKLLAPYGFKLKKYSEPKSFDNYYIIFSSKDLNVRVWQDRGFETMSISSVHKPEEWFDIGLIKLHLTKARKLDKVYSIEDLEKFLVTNFSNIKELFDKKRSETKDVIKELGKKRFREMFKGHFADKG